MRYLIVLLTLCITSVAFADITIDTRRLVDAGRIIDVSWDSINMLKFPDEIKEIKTTKKINTSIQGNIALISLGQPVMTEVYVMTNSDKVYSLILKPKEKAMAFNYVFIDHELEVEKAIQKETATPFEVTIRDIMIQVKQNGKVTGYQAKSFSDLIFRKENLFLEKVLEHVGMNLVIEVWNVVNDSGENITLREREFYEEGIVSIMFDEQNSIKPGKNSTMYIIRKKS